MFSSPVPSPEPATGSGIAGIRLTEAGQIFFLSFSDLALRPGVKVMVQLEQDQI
jgi:hypothetical protein